MSVTTRGQRLRSRGWRMPDGAVYVGRPSRWGNPFPVSNGDQAAAVAAYRTWLAQRPDLVALARQELTGRVLMCWCRPDTPCHADVLVKVCDEGRQAVAGAGAKLEGGRRRSAANPGAR